MIYYVKRGCVGGTYVPLVYTYFRYIRLYCIGIKVICLHSCDNISHDINLNRKTESANVQVL